MGYLRVLQGIGKRVPFIAIYEGGDLHAKTVHHGPRDWPTCCSIFHHSKEVLPMNKLSLMPTAKRRCCYPKRSFGGVWVTGGGTKCTEWDFEKADRPIYGNLSMQAIMAPRKMAIWDLVFLNEAFKQLQLKGYVSSPMAGVTLDFGRIFRRGKGKQFQTTGASIGSC